MAELVPGIHGSTAAGFVRRLFTRADNPLVRAVARIPAKLRTKLLAAFLAIAALLVLVSLLGVRVLGQANSRSERLKTLQTHRAGYETLLAQATTVRDILGLCAGGADAYKFTGGKAPASSRTNRCLHSIDSVVQTAKDNLGDATDLGFTPSAAEASLFPNRPAGLHEARPRRGHDHQLQASLAPAAPAGRKPGRRPQVRSPIACDARDEQDQSARRGEPQLVRQLTQPLHRRRGRRSRPCTPARLLPLVVAHRADPARRRTARSGLRPATSPATWKSPTGTSSATLGSRVNQMNDELQRLYRELETASQHKSRVPREHVARAAHAAQRDHRLLRGAARSGCSASSTRSRRSTSRTSSRPGNHLLQLINDVLDLSKVEAGQIELELATFALREALERGVRDGARTGEQARRRARASTIEPEVPTSSRRRAQASSQILLQPALQRRQVHARRRPQSTCARRCVDGDVQRLLSATPGRASPPRTTSRIFEEFQQAGRR